VKKQLYLLVGAALAATACSDASSLPTGGSSPSLAVEEGNGDIDLHGRPEPRVFAKKGGARPVSTAGALTYHNGALLVTNKSYAIFWGTQWSNPGDKITGMESFFQGWGGSNYAGLQTEYNNASGAFISAAHTYLGKTIDLSAAPNRALQVSDAVNKACSASGQNPDPSAVYFIFTGTGAGNVGYCAWHSWGSCSNGKPVQVAYMPNIDGVAGCDPQDTYGTGHSQGLAAVANVTAHELAEAITDPRGAGWFAGSGSGENGDKCAWTFTGAVTLGNGTTWKLQQEWSNVAFKAGTGNPNRNGEKGCLQGS
jgi:hypothetical protein